MAKELSAILERDGEWFIAYSPDTPGTNGQGRTESEALASLGDAISLILEDRRPDAMRGLPDDAISSTSPMIGICDE